MVVVWWDGTKWRWTKGIDAGHYIGRTKKLLRWEDDNVNIQCSRCNKFDDQVTVLKNYRRALVAKIGEERVSELEVLAHQGTGHAPKALLSEIINDSRTWVKATLENPNGIMKEQ